MRTFGAGKTSLAISVRGMGGLMSPTTKSWIVRERGTLIVGNPARIRFRESAAELFPELAELKPKRYWNGKMSIEMELGGQSSICAAQVVFLRRQPEEPSSIRKLEAAEVVERLLADLRCMRVRCGRSRRRLCGGLPG